MAEEWMLDVLADLRAFAERNGLERTERQLDDTIRVVAGELMSLQGIARETAPRGIEYAGSVFREFAGFRDA